MMIHISIFYIVLILFKFFLWLKRAYLVILEKNRHNKITMNMGNMSKYKESNEKLYKPWKVEFILITALAHVFKPVNCRW